MYYLNIYTHHRKNIPDLLIVDLDVGDADIIHCVVRYDCNI